MNFFPVIEFSFKEVKINNKNKQIPFDWDFASIKNIFTTKTDHRGIAPKKVEKSSTAIPLLTARIIKSGYLEKFEEYIDYDNFLNRCKRGQVKPGDLVFTTEAPMGNVIICPEIVTALGQRMIAFSDKKNSNLFFKYNFLSNYSQSIFSSKATGSTVLGIKSSTLGKVELFYPPVEEQKIVANFLSKQEKIISDLEKIKNNLLLKLKFNQNLFLSGKTRIKLKEDKVQELLSKNIICFDKENSFLLDIYLDKYSDFTKHVDLSKDIYFSINEENNWQIREVNEIEKKLPCDWIVEQIYNKVNFIKGKSLPENQLNYNGKGLKYLKTTEFWLDSASKRDTVCYTGKVDEKHIKAKDEYVFCMDGFNSKIGEGTLGLISNEDEGIVSTHFVKLEKNDIYYLVVNILKSNYVQNFLMRLGEGTTVKMAGKYIKNLQGIFPKSTVEQKLLSMIFERDEKIIDALKERIKLEGKIFKYLQQELLNGRIRIKTEDNE